jgi:cyclase
MLLKRIMPCLLFNGRALVKTKNFKEPNYIGDPINAIKIYNEKEVDELILLDINASKERRKPYFDKIKEFASECFMPFTYGGGVSDINDFKTLFNIGVEKVAVKKLLFCKPEIVKEAVKVFGAQAIVGVVDVITASNNDYYIHNETDYNSSIKLNDFLNYLENEIGIGEILLQDVTKEGTWSGYNHFLIKEVICKVNVPVIVLGGANSVKDIKEVLYKSGATAAAIGNMAVYQKKGMGVLIRFPKRNDLIENE